MAMPCEGSASCLCPRPMALGLILRNLQPQSAVLDLLERLSVLRCPSSFSKPPSTGFEIAWLEAGLLFIGAARYDWGTCITRHLSQSPSRT